MTGGQVIEVANFTVSTVCGQPIKAILLAYTQSMKAQYDINTFSYLYHSKLVLEA
jgi:orotate phosphoribosyltransferase